METILCKDTVTTLLEKNINEIIKNNCNPNNISDGYHTFGELYDHRVALFKLLCKIRVELCDATHVINHEVWMSKKHSDGKNAYDGWFIMGIGKKKGEQITYHLPLSEWDECLKFAEELTNPPEWDGHTSEDVLKRLTYK